MPKATILIAEDDILISAAMMLTLRQMDYTVCSVVSSGEDAIKQTSEHKPDLVLMDIKLAGEIDGIEAAGEIRSRFHIPFIYVTANSDQATYQRAKETRPFGYLIKPIVDEELGKTIEKALHTK
jgi:two-component system, response regulator PdtaR